MKTSLIRISIKTDILNVYLSKSQLKLWGQFYLTHSEDQMTYQCDYKLQVIHLTFVFVILYITLSPSTLQRKKIKNVNAHTHFKKWNWSPLVAQNTNQFEHVCNILFFGYILIPFITNLSSNRIFLRALYSSLSHDAIVGQYCIIWKILVAD